VAVMPCDRCDPSDVTSSLETSGEADSRTATARARRQRTLTTRQPLRLAMKLALSPSLARAASIIAMMSFVLCTVFDDIECNLSFQRVEDEADV
jgi:hypothetical protein